MRKLFLLVVMVVACGSVALGQGESSTKRRAVRTGAPNGIFTPAVISGDLVFTSGQIGSDPKTGQLGETFEAQFEQVFKNLTAVLEAAGSSSEHILKATVFLTDMNDYNKLNELYKAKFKGDPPARTCVQVAKLPRDAKVEIEAVALLK